MRSRVAARRDWGEQFRRFRAEYLYSQRELARLLNCCKRTISSIEVGEVRNPHRELQRKFRALEYKFEQKALLREAERQTKLRALRTKRRSRSPRQPFREERISVGA